MSDLLPCPFCGGRAYIEGAFELDVVRCDGCGISGVPTANTLHAVAAWNRRAPADPAPNSGVVTVLSHTGPLPSPASDIIPPLVNAPADPALLALDRELRIRNLIAEREFNTAAANREIAQFGEWRCDHDAFDLECAAAIARLLAPDGAESEVHP